jgi:DNA-binding winged helix-turn-helix (wHTH) protein
VSIDFGAVRLDTDRRQLFRGTAELHLSPKAYELLRALVENRPRAMAKHELIAQLWPSTYVTESSLAALVREIRCVLEDDARSPRFIRTVHRFGYAFVAAPAVEQQTRAGIRLTARGCWLTWEARDIPLHEGTNVLGREPQAEAVIDAATVSRRHARIQIAGQGAILDDLGSKNGTYVGGTRVTGPTPVLDGDEIRVGSAVVRFRMTPPAGSTQTQARSSVDEGQ